MNPKTALRLYDATRDLMSHARLTSRAAGDAHREALYASTALLNALAADLGIAPADGGLSGDEPPRSRGTIMVRDEIVAVINARVTVNAPLIARCGCIVQRAEIIGPWATVYRPHVLPCAAHRSMALTVTTNPQTGETTVTPKED